jgi:sugar phosphate isomerase/epimerase
VTPIGVGLSSGTLPAASASELARGVRLVSGCGADLRIGKGHGWERDGVGAGLATLAAAGLEVFFTGIGMWLGGRPDARREHDELVQAPPGPVKVFCRSQPDAGAVREQLATAAALHRELWIEIHEGGPGAVELTRLAARTGIGIVLDLLGLLRTGGATAAQLDAMAPHVDAVQVKGVEVGADGVRHRALRPGDLDVVLRVLRSGRVRAVTLESRAGRPERDMKVITEVLCPAVGRTPVPPTREERA